MVFHTLVSVFFRIALTVLLLACATTSGRAQPSSEPLIFRPGVPKTTDELKSKISFSNPVIFLPGAMGSRLADSQRTVIWGKSIWKMKGQFDKLAIPFDQSDTGIRPVGLVDEILVVGNIFKIKQYSDIMNYFKAVGLEEKTGNLFIFPYDWRKSAANAAKLLDDQIQVWKTRIGKSDTKFTIVAHSMGGLVAQYYINQLGGHRNVSRLIMLGTPSYGSLKGLKMFLGGLDDEINNFLGESNVRRVIVTLPGIYELLPIYKNCCVIEAGGQQPVDIFDVSVWKKFGWIKFSKADEKQGWEYVGQRLKDALNFHHSLRGVGQKVEIHKIVGHTQNTLDRIVFDKNGKELRIESAPGDGTVIESSASIGDLQKNVQFVVEKHGSMYMDDNAKRKILTLTADPDPQLELYYRSVFASDADDRSWERVKERQIFSPFSNDDVQIGLADVVIDKSYYQPSSPVALSVAVKDINGTPVSGLSVEAVLEQVSMTLKEASPSQGVYRGSFQAPTNPGAYEVLVRIGGLSPIREFLEVIP